MKLTILFLLVLAVSCGKDNTTHGDNNPIPLTPDFICDPNYSNCAIDRNEQISDFIIRSAQPLPQKISITINGKVFFNECRFQGDEENYRVRITRAQHRGSIQGTFIFENDRHISLQIMDCRNDTVFFASRHVEGVDEDRNQDGRRRYVINIFNYRPEPHRRSDHR